MIPSLEELTWWQRGLLLVVIVAIITLAILMFGQAESEPVKDLQASKWDGHLNDLDKQALDEAYKSRIHHLFEVWMKDETGQPERASVGVRQARRAYIHAMGKVEEREGKQ